MAAHVDNDDCGCDPDRRTPSAATTLTSSASGPRSRTLPLYRPQVELQNFKVFYFVHRDRDTVFEDMLVHQHGNGVCAIALAPFHCARTATPAPRLAALSFRIGAHDYASIDISGKRKRGAQTVDAHTVIAELAVESANVSGHCNGDGDAPPSAPPAAAPFRVRAAVPHGAIIETNDLAIRNPQLLLEQPEALGWICLLLAQDTARASRDWLTPDEYARLRVPQ